MVRINLLPWREELRKEQQRQFLVSLAGAVVLMLLVVAYVHMHINGMIANQESRNGYLQEQIRQVDARIKEINELEQKRQQLLARMKVIGQLQGNRSEIVYLFDSLSRAVPEGLHLLTLKQTGNNLVMEGRAQSNARISSFMRNLDASDWFRNPVLEIIQTDSRADRGGMRSFTLRVTLTSGPTKE